MKEKIVEQATELFIKLGFKSVTMDDIANEMGISKKTIYLHFKNKTELVEESTLQLFNKIVDGIQCIRDQHKNPIEELYDIKKMVMVFLHNERASTEYQLQKYYPKIFSWLRSKQFETMQSCVLENLKKGVGQGIYRENLNMDFISRIYFSGITSLKNQALFPTEPFPIKTLMEDYLEYHLRGIVTPKGRTILNTLINSNHE
ncbi:MAG: TetR/AcrR family transcriptional regulator [Sediminicola sp.]